MVLCTQAPREAKNSDGLWRVKLRDHTLSGLVYSEMCRYSDVLWMT